MGLKDFATKLAESQIGKKFQRKLDTQLSEKKGKTEEEIEKTKLETAQKAKETAKKVGEKTLEGTKKIGAIGAAGAVAGGAIAGRAVAATGKATIRHISDGGSTNLFFFLAMIFHIIDSLFQYNITQLRFTIYFILGIIGWLWVFRQPGESFISRGSLFALSKSFIIAATAFFLPVILPRYLVEYVSIDLLNILLALWPIYLLWFVFIEPTTPLLHSIQKGIVFFWLVIGIMAVYSAAEAGTLKNIPALQNTVNTDFLGAIGNVWQLFKNSLTDLITAIVAFPKLIETGFERQIKYASGEHYAGKEEQTEEKLGVFLKDLKASNPGIKEDESVEIWGILRVKSAADDAINITLNCNSNEKQGTMSKTLFTIYGSDEMDIDCKFNEGFKKGSAKISFLAAYNFKSSSYLKTYFIDEERKQSMKRAGIDLFNEYGITEKTPISIYTSGPIKIGIDTASQPIGLSSETNPKIGFTIENTWEGKIKNINDITIKLPRGMELDSSNCGYEFDKETTNEFNIYKIKDVQNLGEIKEYRSFNCRAKIINQDEILGNVPLSTKYFRVAIDYLFESETNIHLTIK